MQRILKQMGWGRERGMQKKLLCRKNGSEINLGRARKVGKYSASFQSEDKLLSMEQEAE